MNLLTEIEEQYRIALKRKRIAAALVDFTFFWIIGMVIGIFSGDYYQDSEGVGFDLKGFPAFIFALFWFLSVPISEGLTGQTIGKRFLKIKVVRTNLSPTNIWISLARHLLDIVDLILFIGLIVASVNKQKRRIGDLLAGTIVIDQT